MKINRKQIQVEADRQMKTRAYQRDGEGRIILHMTVEDDSGFLSVFSSNQTPVISGEVAEFLEHSTDAVPPREALTLRIRSGCIDDGEQILYREAIKEYYTQKYLTAQRELRRNFFIVLALALLGVGTLVIRFLYELWQGNTLWAEVIDIAAWVFLWESIDVGFFSNRALRVQRMRYLALMDMKIEYTDPT